MERYAKYDNLKFFLICCVVLGHLGSRFADDSVIVAGAQCWIYLFHMPAFIFVAGLFSKRTVRENRWVKFVPYIFLFLGMEALNFIVQVVRSGIESASLDLLHENGIPWYALAMFWWYLITVLVKKVHPVYVMTVALAFAMLVGYTTSIGSFLVLTRTIVFFPFFYAGYLIEPQVILDKLAVWWVKLISCIVLVVSIVLVFTNIKIFVRWRILFRGLGTYAKIKTEADDSLGFLWRLGAYVVSFILIFAIIAVMPSIKSYISTVGRKTLPVYFFHGSVISFSLFVIPGFHEWIETSNTAIICAAFSIVIVFFTSLPIFDWPVRKIMNVPSYPKGGIS